MLRCLVVLGLSTYALSCASPRPDPLVGKARPRNPKELAAAVASLQKRTEALLQEQHELIWKSWTEGTAADLAKSYAGKEVLFTRDTLQLLDDALKIAPAPPSPDRRALEALHAHVVGEVVGRALAEDSGAIANLEASLTFSASGTEHPLRHLARLLANERSAPARRALYQGATELMPRLTSLIRRREDRTRKLLQSLGYPAVDAFAEELRAMKVEEVSALAETLLSQTQDGFVQLLGEQARRELGLRRDDLRMADLPRLFAPPSADALFPKEALWPRTQGFARDLGFPLEELKNVTVDLREHPRKNPRPLALAVKVPDDVRLSLRPLGGLREQAVTLHELGHVLHAAFTREKRFSLATLGHPLLAQATGELLSEISLEPTWLLKTANVGTTVAAPLSRAAALHKLWLVRRAAGQFLYSVAISRLPVLGSAEGETQDESAAKKLYKAILSRTHGFELNDEEATRYLTELVPLHGGADALRAHVLAAQLRSELERRFGGDWDKTGGARELLMSLWATGNALDADEIAQAIGAPALSPQPFLERITTKLGMPRATPLTQSP